MFKNRHINTICGLLFLPYYYILLVLENQHEFIK